MSNIFTGGGYESLGSGDDLPELFRKAAKNFEALNTLVELVPFQQAELKDYVLPQPYANFRHIVIKVSVSGSGSCSRFMSFPVLSDKDGKQVFNTNPNGIFLSGRISDETVEAGAQCGLINATTFKISWLKQSNSPNSAYRNLWFGVYGYN